MEIIIKRCYECPYCNNGRDIKVNYWWCGAPNNVSYKPSSRELGQIKIEIIKPEWCPLPITLNGGA